MSPDAKASLWFGLYLLLIVLPLVVGAAWPGEAAGRPLSLQFGVALGFVAFAVMASEFALISKVRSLAGVFGQDALIQFHRRLGLLASALILLHSILMLRSGYPLQWLNPLAASSIWAMRWGVLAGFAIFLLVVLSLGRKRLRIPYGWWQWSHGFLAEGAVLMALAHILLFGGFSSGNPMRVLLAAYFMLLISVRVGFVLVKPLRIWSKPWEVLANVEELGDSRTLVLRPVGHSGMTFEPGQFAYLSLGATPFHKEWHPISMSSCAYDQPGQDIAFTIKNFGDWSGKIVPALKPGTRIWVDGPYGVFTPDREQGPGYVLIGGGAGITPLFSMCQTFAERGDVRPVLLFFGGRDRQSLTFADQLDALQKRMNLRVICALEHPPENWTGESGYITTEILKKYLPRQYKRYRFFVCGPAALMDAMETSLTEIGVPPHHIHTERFNLV
jgi:predicted ferric reductase